MPNQQAITTKKPHPFPAVPPASVPLLRGKTGEPLLDHPIINFEASEVTGGKAFAITNGKPFEKHPKKNVIAEAIFASRRKGGEVKG